MKIDLLETEWRQIHEGASKDAADHQTSDPLQYRRPSLRGEIVALVDLALEEIGSALRRCWSLLRDVNMMASPATLYRNLEQIAAEPGRYLHAIYLIDPETRGHLEDHHSDGWLAFENGQLTEASLADAARQARSKLLRPAQGRPKGLVDHAGLRLGQALAEIYWQHRGEKPTRRRQPKRFGVEYGPFKDFVEEVLSVVPRRLRQTAQGGAKSADHLVRVGVEHINKPR